MNFQNARLVAAQENSRKSIVEAPPNRIRPGCLDATARLMQRIRTATCIALWRRVTRQLAASMAQTARGAPRASQRSAPRGRPKRTFLLCWGAWQTPHEKTRWATAAGCLLASQLPSSIVVYSSDRRNLNAWRSAHRTRGPGHFSAKWSARQVLVADGCSLADGAPVRTIPMDLREQQTAQSVECWGGWTVVDTAAQSRPALLAQTSHVPDSRDESLEDLVPPSTRVIV